MNFIYSYLKNKLHLQINQKQKQKTMNFLDLPYELQEIIYNKLNILDKCVFDRVAKFKYIKRDSMETKKNLGVLYKVITSKELTELAFLHLRTLTTYNRLFPDDPTIREIAMTFPEVCKKIPETLYEKVKSGTVTEEYLKSITREDIYVIDHLFGLISEKTVDMFKLLYKNEYIKEYIDYWKNAFYFFTMFNCNEDLFLYLKTNRIFGEEMNYDYKKTEISLINNTRKRAFLIKHFTYTPEEINYIKKHCLDNLYIDAYLDFDKLH